MTTAEQASQIAKAICDLHFFIEESPDPEAARRMVIDTVRVLEAQFGPIGVDVEDWLLRIEFGLLSGDYP